MGSPFALSRLRGPVGELLHRRGAAGVPQELGGARLLPGLDPLVLGQVQPVELIDELLTVQEVVLRLPCVLRAPIALPPDEVLPFALPVLALVYNPLNLGKETTVRKEDSGKSAPGGRTPPSPGPGPAPLSGLPVAWPQVRLSSEGTRVTLTGLSHAYSQPHPWLGTWHHTAGFLKRFLFLSVVTKRMDFTSPIRCRVLISNNYRAPIRVAEC